MQRTKDPNKVIVSVYAARLIPLILVGVVGYATYVLVALLSVNYLLRKHHNHGAAIPVLVVYSILFILMTTSFLRLSYITATDPPYVPLGAYAPPARRDRIPYQNKDNVKAEEEGIAMSEIGNREKPGGIPEYVGTRNDPDSPGLELFYTKDVYVCEVDLRPSWCAPCANWKPDRAHHCSSSGRCIYKMDHFCPWVGGPIGENNLKFFIQFNGYAALFCIHIVVVMAFYLHRQIVTEGESFNRHFAAILGLAAFFGMFTGAILVTCLDHASNNLTQVEKLGSKSVAHQLAVLKPSPEELQRISPAGPPWTPMEITYPLELTVDQRARFQSVSSRINTSNPPNAVLEDSSQIPQPREETPNQPIEQSPAQDASPSMPSPERLGEQKGNAAALADDNNPGPAAPRDSMEILPISPLGTQTVNPMDDGGRPNGDSPGRDGKATRTFGLVRMEPGDNPWDLGSRLANLQTVMGTSVFDYFLPLRRSPCCDHDDPESYYSLGPVVDIAKCRVYYMDANDMRTKVKVKKGTKPSSGVDEVRQSGTDSAKGTDEVGRGRESTRETDEVERGRESTKGASTE